MSLLFAISSNLLPGAFMIAGGFILVAVLLAAWRLWRGPAEADRILGLDLGVGCVLAGLVVLTLVTGQLVLLDVVVLLALVGFIGTVALGFWLRDQKGGRE